LGSLTARKSCTSVLARSSRSIKPGPKNLDAEKKKEPSQKTILPKVGGGREVAQPLISKTMAVRPTTPSNTGFNTGSMKEGKEKER